MSDKVVRSPQEGILASPPREDAAPHAPLSLVPRVWPAVVLVVLMWLGVLVPFWLAPESIEAFFASFWVPALTLLLGAVWFVFFSRLPWSEALLYPGAFIVFLMVGVALSDPDFRGLGHLMHVLPWLLTASAVWLVLSVPLSWPARRNGLLTVAALGWGVSALIRFDGVTGNFRSELSPRWTTTAAEIYNREKPAVVPGEAAVLALALKDGDVPGFRGANRDSIVRGTNLVTDWEANPPKELWKRRIGPGWGSFAVVGNYVFTQEQFAEQEEAVVCLEADTGNVVWKHGDAERFSEPVAKSGPRATPTFHDGKIYALSASGTLNCLDARTGKRLWHADIKISSYAKIPQWGFAASPLVAHGLVTVYADGPDGNAVVAYDAETGKLAWTAGKGLHGYASTQLLTLAGKEVLAVPTGYGLTLLDPKTGAEVLEYEWKLNEGMARCCQVTAVSPTEVIFGAGFGMGTRRVQFALRDDKLSAEQVWETKKLNPYFNDHVAHEGYIYGFDGTFFTCLDASTGESKWRQRGYDAGQVVLLADQGLLLVISERGKVSLLKTNPLKHERLGQIAGIEGKTWNHPVLAGDRLFIRNGEWAACYQLPRGK
jgi:outer membrane protein assembly factor BamB